MLVVAVAVVVKLEVTLDEVEMRKLVFHGSIWLRGCWWHILLVVVVAVVVKLEVTLDEVEVRKLVFHGSIRLWE